MSRRVYVYCKKRKRMVEKGQEHREETSGLQIRVDKQGYVGINRSLPKNYPPHLAAGGKTLPDGTCITTSRAEVERTIGAANDQGEGLVWDGFREIS